MLLIPVKSLNILGSSSVCKRPSYIVCLYVHYGGFSAHPYIRLNSRGYIRGSDNHQTGMNSLAVSAIEFGGEAVRDSPGIVSLERESGASCRKGSHSQLGVVPH